MTGFDKLESDVMGFLDDSKLEFFDAEELVADLYPQMQGEEKENTLRRVCNILDACELVARKHSSDLYYILDNFFRKTVFFCKPREIELAKGILIPGARFEPFHPAELYPDELELTAGTSKTPFELTDVKLKYGEVADLFLMLGPAGTMDMLTAESQENYDAMRQAGGLKDSIRIELEAFDLSAFYRDSGFRNGDFIRVEIESYSEGKMRLTHVSRLNAPVPQEINVWIDKFEAALSDVCLDYKDSLEIHEQLMYAYVYAAASGNDVRRRPGPAVDQYQNMMRTISFRRDDSEWTLISNESLEDSPDRSPVQEKAHEHECSCGCGHEHHHGQDVKDAASSEFGDLAPDDFTISQGALDSIDAILAEIHAPFREIELQAYMLDCIANGAETFEEFSRVHETLLKLVFSDDAQETAYLNYVDELWEVTFEHYGFNMDSLKAPLRARLLELTDSRMELSVAVLSYKNSTLPAELQEQMANFHKDILDTFFVLDRDAILEEEDVESMELRVGDLEDAFEDISEKLTAWLERQITNKK